MELRRSDYALLGILRMGPGSGYDIKKRIERSVAFFWQESYGRIYPRLKALQAAGLARRRERASARGGVRQVYAITRAGERALARWIEADVVPTPARDELLLKLFVSGPESLAALRAHLERYAAERGAELAVHERSRKQLESLRDDDAAWTLRQLTLDYGERIARAELEWARDARRALEALS